MTTANGISGSEAFSDAGPIVAFDPGRNIGVAIVDESGRLLRSQIVEFGELERLRLPTPATIVVGNGTGCERVRTALQNRGLTARLVDEEGTSLEGRRLYFRDNPPRPPLAWLPPGLRWPPRLIDDYAAYAIALRHLQARRLGGGRNVSEGRRDVTG